MMGKPHRPNNPPRRARRFLIADAHPIVRSGLAKVLRDRFANAIIVFATTGDEAVAAGQAGLFDAVLLEIALTDRDGFPVLSKLHQQSPGTPLLVITVHTDEKLALDALRAGASGFIGKSGSVKDLVRAVEKVMSGALYLSDELTRRVSQRLPPARLRQFLSPLELEVLAQMAAGRSAEQIGHGLTRNAKRAMAETLPEKGS